MTGSDAPAAQARSRRRGLLVLTALIVIAAAAWYGYSQAFAQHRERTDNAYVHGNVVGVMAQTAGTVVAVTVDDTDYVRAGDVVARLDDTDAVVAVERAGAELARTVREVSGLYARRDQARAALDAARVARRRAAADFERRRGLSERRAISSEELAHAREEHAAASAAVQTVAGSLAVAQSRIGGYAVADHPAVLVAAARLTEALIALDRTRVLAPVDGHVAQRTVQVGVQVGPDTRLMHIVPLGELWVVANFKENQLRHLRSGQPVTFTTDLYGAASEFHGTVQGVGAGTGSVFALLPPQNATGNWIKIVQRVPVRLALDPGVLDAHPLLIGASVTAVVDTRARDGALLAASAPRAPRYGTQVYATRAERARQRVAEILAQHLPQE